MSAFEERWEGRHVLHHLGKKENKRKNGNRRIKKKIEEKRRKPGIDQ